MKTKKLAITQRKYVQLVTQYYDRDIISFQISCISFVEKIAKSFNHQICSRPKVHASFDCFLYTIFILPFMSFRLFGFYKMHINKNDERCYCSNCQYIFLWSFSLYKFPDKQKIILYILWKNKVYNIHTYIIEIILIK